MISAKYTFRVDIETHDQTGDVLAVYFLVRKGKSHETKEFANGRAFADYDKKGLLLGIELLGPCKISVVNQITTEAPARQFFKNTIPRQLIAA